ncbi:pimeloyl-ACP methyl ester carboxylesterase [Bradyrhizobium diazoefficiens]
MPEPEIARFPSRPYRATLYFSTKPLKQGGKAMSSTRVIKANGIDLFIREAGQGPLVMLCHGWPELSYSWRHQIPALAAAGFHVVAPDMRGYGQSAAPADVSAYSIFDTVGDIVGLVQALGESKAMVVGHDWGAPVAWHAALFRPDIFTAVAGLSVPPPFRGRGKPLDLLRQGGVTNFYWQYFQVPGVAEVELERDVARTMRIVLGGRGLADPSAAMFVQEGKGFLGHATADEPLPDWLSEADLAYFTETFRKSGFRGGLNWYRNLDRNWELTAPLAGCADPPAVPLHCRFERRRHYRPDRRQARQRTRARAAKSHTKTDHRRRRPLGAAGAARRGQRCAREIPARSVGALADVLLHCDVSGARLLRLGESAPKVKPARILF